MKKKSLLTLSGITVASLMALSSTNANAVPLTEDAESPFVLKKDHEGDEKDKEKESKDSEDKKGDKKDKHGKKGEGSCGSGSCGSGSCG